MEPGGWIIPAGHRMFKDKWLDAFLVAPYTEAQLEHANTWRLQDHVNRAVRGGSGAPDFDRLVRSFSPSGAPDSSGLVRPNRAHIQSSYRTFSERVQNERSSASLPLRGSRPRSTDQEREAEVREKRERNRLMLEQERTEERQG